MIKKILLKRDENKSMKRKICDPCHIKKRVVKNVRYYVTTSEESEDTFQHRPQTIKKLIPR
jgi:hypothetical protein